MRTSFRILTLLAFALLVAGTAQAQETARPRGLGLSGMQRPGMRMLNQRRGQQAPAAAAEDAEKAAEDALKDIPKGTNGVPMRLNFKDAPIEVVLDAYAEAAGKILIPAPNLPKTQITLKTLEDREFTKEEYLEALEVTLTMHGVVLEPFDKIFLRAFERKTVRTQGIRTEMNVSTNGIPEKGRVISQLIRLQHITGDEAQKALEGFKAPEGLFQVFERNNTILVTDTQENINRMLEIVKEIDVENPVLESVFVRQIENALATDIKTALETIVQESQKDDAKQAQSGPKTSGAPGFSSRASTPSQPPRLLNLNNRPGLNRPEPAPVTPNATLMAQVSDADRGMIRGKVLIVADERSNKLIVITAKTNMDFFDKVIETLDVPTTPEVSVEVIRLKYAEAEEVASMLNDLIGNGSSSSQSKNNQNAAVAKNGTANRNLTQSGHSAAGGATSRPQTANPTFSKSASSSLGELNKDNIKILHDKRINGIVVMARKADMKSVKEVIEDMDVKLSQVLIETVIIEVTLGDDLNTGVDWIKTGKRKATYGDAVEGNGTFIEKITGGEDVTETLSSGGYKDGGNGYWYKTEIDAATGDETTSWYPYKIFKGAGGNLYKATTSIIEGHDKVKTASELTSSFKNGTQMLGGGGGTGNIDALMNIGTNAAALSPAGSGINYFLKAKNLNIAAIISASKTDSHAKYIASPVVMTVDNKEAVVEATSARQFLTGWQAVSSTYAGSGMPSPTYSPKDIGIKLTMTPKINPNGTIMLTVEEEYSQVSEKQSMLSPNGSSYEARSIDVPATRKMQSDVLLENMQTVILGGLVETSKTESETGIPILKDIPWIGKWLFGSVSQTEARKELLVFLTPYVLDDANAAQAEALRRKKTLSDPRPWDDNGWSLSPVADPVSKKEQLRRLNEEWKRQDEERANKRAIEEAKEKRAARLREMDEEDRREWARRHEKELLAEQERFADEQKDLREIIDGIREKNRDAAPAEKAPAPEPGS